MHSLYVDVIHDWLIALGNGNNICVVVVVI